MTTKSRYNTAIKRLTERYQSVNTGQSMTRQSEAGQTDINNIVNRFQKQGVITHLNKHGGQYADVTGADFTKWAQSLSNVQNMFDELPSEIRTRFNNNPAGFLEYVQNPENKDEMVKLGLARGTVENPPTSSLLNPSTPSTINEPSATDGTTETTNESSV